jgi:uncharacterized membrane protein
MRRTSLALAFAGILAIVGCENKSPPGGPGTPRGSGSGPVVGTADSTFTISVPNVDIKQGESKKIDVSIKRGKNFDQDVKLEVTDGPKGVTFKFDDTTLKASATETHLMIEASAEAALGTHDVNLHASPATGAKTSTKFKVEVKKP